MKFKQFEHFYSHHRQHYHKTRPFVWQMRLQNCWFLSSLTFCSSKNQDKSYHFHFLTNITFIFSSTEIPLSPSLSAALSQDKGRRRVLPSNHSFIKLYHLCQVENQCIDSVPDSTVQTKLQKPCFALHYKILNLYGLHYIALHNKVLKYIIVKCYFTLLLMASITYSIYMGWHRTTSKPQSDDSYQLSSFNASQSRAI